MATDNRTATPDAELTGEQQPIVLDARRAAAICAACYEIDACTQLLQQVTYRFDDEVVSLIARQSRLAYERINALNGAILSAVDDDTETTESIEERVYGDMPREATMSRVGAPSVTNQQASRADVSPPAGAEAFMAGVALFDELLDAIADNCTGVGKPEDYWIDAEYRDGLPFRNLALQFINRIVETPALAVGFSAVLADHLGIVASGGVPDCGARYASGLSAADLVGVAAGDRS
jgi:hypothetical protein